MSGGKHHGPFGNLLMLTDGGSHACTADLPIAADAARRGGEIGQRLTRCARPDLAGHGNVAGLKLQVSEEILKSGDDLGPTAIYCDSRWQEVAQLGA